MRKYIRHGRHPRILNGSELMAILEVEVAATDVETARAVVTTGATSAEERCMTGKWR